MKSIYSGLTEEQIVKLEMFLPPHLFAVISWGCAATTWLSGTLNSHPDIFCVHAMNHAWVNFGASPIVDGLDYLRIVGMQGSTNLAAGDVHGINSNTVPAIKEVLGDQFSCVSVVRDPMSRLNSFMALFEKGEKFRWWNLSHLKQLIKQELPLPDDSYASQFFVMAVNMLNAVQQERQLGKIYRTEDLTTNPAILSDFVAQITNGKVRADADWAHAAVARRPTNSHRARVGEKRPLMLAPWQKEVMRLVVSPQTWEIYTELGYSIPEFI